MTVARPVHSDQLLRTGRLVVLHVVQALRGGGAQTLVREIVPRLRHRGVDARVLCAYGNSQLAEHEKAMWSDIVYSEERVGVPRARYFANLRARTHQIKPILVHTHTHAGSVWGRAAAILSGVPAIVHTEHDSVESLPFIERAVVGLLNLRTDAVVVFSDRSSDLVRRRENIPHPRVIPNGIQVRRLPTLVDRQRARRMLGIDGACLTVGVIASLEPYKNPELAVDSMACLPYELRKMVRLVFFGDGSLRANLVALARKLGIGELVRFYGFRPDLHELLPGLDLVLSTSNREMMPISFLEAMNNGIPIIGTPHGGTLDLVRDRETGIVLKTWDRNEATAALEWALMHHEWRKRAGAAAHQSVVDKFDIDKISDQYLSLYTEILDRKSTGR
jgi:glycosyltransferase involved in cell wall biosynthesis